MLCAVHFSFFFFFNDTATTEIYTLSLHDALPISVCDSQVGKCRLRAESSSAARSCAADRQGIQHMNPSRTRIQVASILLFSAGVAVAQAPGTTSPAPATPDQPAAVEPAVPTSAPPTADRRGGTGEGLVARSPRA